MNVLYLEIREKPGIFQLPYQPHSSSVDYGRELFKPSKNLASLRVCNEKKFFGFGFRFFVSDVMSKVGFWSFLPAGICLGPNH